VHKNGVAFAVQHTARKFKFTLPGPMTIVDTIADEYYGDRVKMALALAEALNEEALELERCGVDTIQFDEPAFNVYLDEVREWGIAALERAALGLRCTTAVHICYGYGIKANNDWKASLGDEWRQYEKTFPHLAASKIDQVSLECMHSRVPASLMGLLKGKDVHVGVIDVASNTVETPEEVAAVLREAMKYVPAERMLASTNCGMAPTPRNVAYAKLRAIAAGAALVRKELGIK
jgi:5-methyltetrahydropteroyltriglutamate--homocysteine methyltransferase